MNRPGRVFLAIDIASERPAWPKPTNQKRRRPLPSKGLLVGEGGLELRFSGLSTVRCSPGTTDLTGCLQTTALQCAEDFYPVSTRPVEVSVEEPRSDA